MANWLANFTIFSSVIFWWWNSNVGNIGTPQTTVPMSSKNPLLSQNIEQREPEPNNWVAALGSYGLLYSFNVSHPKWKTTIFLVKVFLRVSRKTPNSTTFEVTELQQKSWLAQVIGNCIMADCYNPHTGPVPFPHLQALSSSSPDLGKGSYREPQEWEPISYATGPIRITWKIGEFYGNPAACGGKGRATNPKFEVFLRMVVTTRYVVSVSNQTEAPEVRSYHDHRPWLASWKQLEVERRPSNDLHLSVSERISLPRWAQKPVLFVGWSNFTYRGHNLPSRSSTGKAPEKLTKTNRKVTLQLRPPFFRGELLNFGGA